MHYVYITHIVRTKSHSISSRAYLCWRQRNTHHMKLCIIRDKDLTQSTWCTPCIRQRADQFAHPTIDARKKGAMWGWKQRCEEPRTNTVVIQARRSRRPKSTGHIVVRADIIRKTVCFLQKSNVCVMNDAHDCLTTST